ncbi:MAG: endolytic transglycosylase MltG [Patescibacteria group bacterium]|nr:endolytic transglycosylase MltG [Patescibacteria group bacterium]
MIKKIFSLIFILAVGSAWWLMLAIFGGNDQEAEIFVVESGQGAGQVAKNLSQAGLIKNELAFRFWLKFKDAEDKIAAGSYSLPENISIRQLANIFSLGPGNSQRSITLIEGWTRQMMADYLDKNGFSGADFMDLSSRKDHWQEKYAFLADAPAGASLEGYIFPDTYFVDNRTSVNNLIDRSLANFDRKLTADLRQEMQKQSKTIFEVLNLASIVEREVPLYSDKQMVADIFLKRLDIGMGLQSDATINYVTGKGLAQPTFKDLEVDSPYNTYKYRGLPPGPISNPGLDSIKAVIYPTTNPYYFFLTTKENKVIYSRDYEEHLANKRKYLD